VKVVGVVEYGGPEALQVLQLPDPQIEPGQVRIRVRAAAVSPTDTLIRNGARAEAQRAVGPPPYVPGMDAAGVLEEIGEGVHTDVALGDHVMAIVVPKGSHGAYSEQIVVPSESTVRVPAGATDVEASTLPMSGWHRIRMQSTSRHVPRTAYAWRTTIDRRSPLGPAS